MINRFPSGVWMILLIVSVLLNGVILGAVAAGGLHLGQSRLAPGVQFRVAPLAGGFPDSVRGDFLERLRRTARETRPLMREAREANDQVMEALAADPFDADAARAAFARSAAVRAALEQRAQETTLDVFADLPADVRRRMVEAGRDWRDGRPRVILRQELRGPDGPPRRSAPLPSAGD